MLWVWVGLRFGLRVKLFLFQVKKNQVRVKFFRVKFWPVLLCLVSIPASQSSVFFSWLLGFFYFSFSSALFSFGVESCLLHLNRDFFLKKKFLGLVLCFETEKKNKSKGELQIWLILKKTIMDPRKHKLLCWL